MIFFPYNTDAPIYHRPIGTIGLIAANVFVFVLTLFHPELRSRGILPYGVGLTPLPWLTSNFLHAGVLHLLGNMLFLWSFGLIVEGKLGWKRFLPLYLAIGAVTCLLEQLVFWNYRGASLGASSVIFGLMALCLLWAPRNELSVAYLFIYRGGSVDIPIVWFAALLLAWSILIVAIFRTPSSEMLHLFGAVVAVPFGVIMLRTRTVDCEGWDLFSVWRGEQPGSVNLPPKKPVAHRRNRKQGNTDKARPSPGKRFSELVRKDKPQAAVAELASIRHLNPEWQPSPEDLQILARALRQRRDWNGAVVVYRELLVQSPSASDARLDLAEILVFCFERPRAAAKVLTNCSRKEFRPPQLSRLASVEEEIQRLLDEGVMEVESESF